MSNRQLTKKNYLNVQRLIRCLSRSLLLCVTVAGVVFAGPAPTQDIKSETDHWWSDYANGLKRVNAEKDDHKGSLILVQMRVDLLPRFERLVAITQKWKKNHSEKEYNEVKAWSENNLNAKEATNLMSSPQILQRAQKSKDFGRAYSDFNREMAMAGRRGMNVR